MEFDLATWRKDNQVSQSEVADACGCRQGYISFIERTGMPDNLTFLRKLSDFTGVPIQELRPDAFPETPCQSVAG